MRFVVALVILVAAPAAARAAIDVCAAERAEAAATPPADEDVRAYQACMDRWRDVLARAEAELHKPPPQHLDACDGPFARWQAAAAVAPENFDAMQRRLAARDEVDRCVHDVLTPKEPLAVVAARLAAEKRRAEIEHDRREGHGWVILGSVLLSVGGAGFTAAGGVGLALYSRLDDGLGVVVMASSGFIAGGMMVAGAAILGFGARRLARAR